MATKYHKRISELLPPLVLSLAAGYFIFRTAGSQNFPAAVFVILLTLVAAWSWYDYLTYFVLSDSEIIYKRPFWQTVIPYNLISAVTVFVTDNIPGFPGTYIQLQSNQARLSIRTEEYSVRSRMALLEKLKGSLSEGVLSPDVEKFASTNLSGMSPLVASTKYVLFAVLGLYISFFLILK